MTKKISFGLSVSDLNSAIKELRQYQADLNIKCQKFTERLADLGLETAKAIMKEHIYSGETIGSLRIETDEIGSVTKLRIVVESEAILFLEFGAGDKYSGTNKPKASEMGYGPGTYPGAGHWNDPNGWWFPTDAPRLIRYTDSSGQGWGHSYGIEAAMPMYNASVEMMRNVRKIAKEVFHT